MFVSVWGLILYGHVTRGMSIFFQKAFYFSFDVLFKCIFHNAFYLVKRSPSCGMFYFTLYICFFNALITDLHGFHDIYCWSPLVLFVHHQVLSCFLAWSMAQNFLLGTVCFHACSQVLIFSFLYLWLFLNILGSWLFYKCIQHLCMISYLNSLYLYSSL